MSHDTNDVNPNMAGHIQDMTLLFVANMPMMHIKFNNPPVAVANCGALSILRVYTHSVREGSDFNV